MDPELAFWEVDTRQPGSQPAQLVFRDRVSPLVPRLERLLQTAWQRRIPVVSTVCVRAGFHARALREDELLVGVEPEPTPDGLEQRIASYKRIFLERHSCGTSAENIRNRAFDVFVANPNAERVVRAVGAARWVVFGDSVGYCLRATAEGLLRLGVSVTVLEDVAGRGIDTPQRAREILSELAAAGARLERADRLLATLD